MGFSGWPLEAVEFFRGLQADNTKTYWNMYKARYEASVREPMAELLSGLSGEFGPSRIARPYRDVRFRADKSPYKTEIYATFGRGGYVNDLIVAEFEYRAGDAGTAGYGAAQRSRWTTSSNGRRSGVLMGASGRPAG